MQTSDVSSPSQSQRRAGTITFGLVLLVCGVLMLISLFFPLLDLRWALRLSPLILISLGVEVLLFARGGRRIKYDWAGMILSFFLVAAALCLYALAWYVQQMPVFFSRYDGTWTQTENALCLDYTVFCGSKTCYWDLTGGDTLTVDAAPREGEVDLLVSLGSEVVYSGQALCDRQTFSSPRDGTYAFCLQGRQSSGSLRISKEDSSAALSHTSSPAAASLGGTH